jgi:hypothetical protein
MFLKEYKKIAKLDLAFQWFPEMGLSDAVFYNPLDGYHVITIHGQRTSIASGDWIIQEPDGIHYYPCKPIIFEANHEGLERNGRDGVHELVS